MSESFDITNVQNIFRWSARAGEGYLGGTICFCCLILITPGLGLILRVHLERGRVLPYPSPTLTPSSINLIMCYYRALSFLFRANLCCWETLGLIQRSTFPFKHRALSVLDPLSFEKESQVFKKWTRSWAIQGVSNALLSARLLNAKQTVEQIKIKGSELACLPAVLTCQALLSLWITAMRLPCSRWHSYHPPIPEPLTP